MLVHGVHCAKSDLADPNFVVIGNPDLIARRRDHAIPAEFGGTLGDYVPFYFTPFSIMMYNIHTGYRGITKRGNEELVILVSSLRKLEELNVPYVFTDRHALLRAAQFSATPADLDRIDWDALRRRDFKNDPEDPEKLERYQAEVLVRGRVPIEALLGIGCYNDDAKHRIDADVAAADVRVQSVLQPDWYF
jgi:hypothetical protein